MEQAVINGIAEGSVYAIVAIGLVFINKITEVANFAQGEFAMVAAFVSFSALQLGAPLILALAIAVAAGALLGFGVERIVIRPVADSGSLGMTIVTLGLFYVLHGGALAIWGPEIHPYPSFFGAGTVSVAGTMISPQHLAVIGFALPAALAMSAFLRFTRTGLAMRAIPQNRMGARVIGLNLPRLFALSWGIGSAVSAVAGVLLAPIIFLNVNMMQAVLIKAFAAAVLGGLDSLLGAFVAGLLLGVVENVIAGYVSSYLKDSLAFLFIIAVLLLKPEGLFGSPRREKV